VSASAPQPAPGAGPIVRDLRSEDLGEVVRLDALHTKREKAAYWAEVFRRFVGGPPGRRVGLAAEQQGVLVGYLLGEVRAFEFGSEECGWVFAVGVEPDRLRSKVASRLLTEACHRFREAGIERVRTMVRRNDVPVLSFFRSAGFEGGSFVQLELELGGGS
jgi:ribosomal protein S18 acetylase RimI-like enzyme